MGFTIWIDADDLLQYALTFRRPSGIQRLAFELYGALHGLPGAEVRFVRHDRLRGGFTTIAWEAVAARFDRLTAPDGRAAPMPPAAPADAGRWRLVADRLPAELRAPLARAARAQAAAFGEAATALRAVPKLLRGGGRGASPEQAADGVKLAGLARPGDVLAAFGAPWFDTGHPDRLRRARGELGLRVALLFYDVIPLRRPEWCDPTMTALFRRWFAAAVPQADMLFAISRATAAEVELAAAGLGVKLAGTVVPVPVGSGFAVAAAAQPGGGGPPSGPYVLFVSTLEARKNHVLMVRAWRRLLDDMPAAEVPALVFAGRIGYMVADLMQELRNSAFLGGKVVLVDHPDDAELAALYRGCLFTVFPSLYEGWGLPVTESLAFGKPCLVARATSLPEAGGALARYFDPGSVTDAVRALRATLADRADLRAWEAQVKREFRPVPWADMARAIADGLAPGGTAA